MILPRRNKLQFCYLLVVHPGTLDDENDGGDDYDNSNNNNSNHNSNNFSKAKPHQAEI